MWFLLKDQSGDCLIDPINVSRTSNWFDFKALNNQPIPSCIDILTLLRDTGTDKLKIGFKVRLADAKRHAKLAFILKEKFCYRIGNLFEALYILLCQEDVCVPSLRNTVNLIDRIINILDNNRSAIVEIM
jgi:hypothetical protein